MSEGLEPSGLGPSPEIAPAASDARIAALERENDALRAEVERWRWDATMARRELHRIQTSRFWRLAHLYWQARRQLQGALAGAWPGFGEDREGPPSDSNGAKSLRRSGVPSPSAARIPVPAGFPATPRGRYDVVVFSIIDWDSRFQRPQQMATQFACHGHRVFFLSTSQFLVPDDRAAALSYKAENVVEVRLRTRQPLDIYGGGLESRDLDVLEESFSSLLEELALGDVVALVQIPFWAPLAERLRHRYGWRLVYDCMDDWSSFPGIGERVLALEPRLVAEADLTVVTADRLHDKFRGLAARLLVAKNGVDSRHYERHYGVGDLLDEVTHPVIGYFGALASWVDTELLEKLGRRFPQATIVLAGGHFDVDLVAVERLANVRLLGQRPYAQMPQLLFRFDVCIIPFLVNDVTEATNPVKLYEYLWSGKPVVAPRLTELLPFEEICYLAGSHEEFLAAVSLALDEPLDDPRRLRRRALARENTWDSRYAAISGAIHPTFPAVSVVVVTHGSLPLTRGCLESLLAGETWPRLEVVVVDNASPDDTVEYVRRLADSDPRVRLLPQERNLGFPAASNLGMAAACGDVIVLLNNDTILPPGLIGRLCRHLERDPRIGLLCATTNFCGNEARIEAGYEDLGDMPRFAAGRARREAGKLLDLPVAAMYCVAARREVLDQVGPLDEEFGIGMFEDDDYSLRVRAAGYRVACAEDAYVHHVGQGSFQGLSPVEYQAIWERNQRHYERKWQRRWESHRLRPGVTPVSSKVGSA